VLSFVLFSDVDWEAIFHEIKEKIDAIWTEHQLIRISYRESTQINLSSLAEKCVKNDTKLLDEYLRKVIEILTKDNILYDILQ
jgi:hypothetical protein